MLELSRRRLLATTSALPVATGLLPVAALGTARPARPTEDPWARGARPDFVLSIARHEMAPFGTPIQALLVGGTWPGTTIRYRKGDRFRVLVENALDQPTSLHWHGLVCPNLEDGVPNVTQAPIGPGDALYYEFDLKQAGTFWYHSHFGLQEQQGLAGPLIIEDPNERHAYDEDLIIIAERRHRRPGRRCRPEDQAALARGRRQQSLHPARRRAFSDRRALRRLSSERAHAGRPLEPYYHVEFGDVVRFDLVNRTPMAHPMHLHGHVFRVLPEGADPADAPLRDTVVAWPNGRVSMEFVAYNPGKWFFHCHNAWHLAVGMAQAVQYQG